MGEPRHAEACGAALVEIGDVAFEVLQPLDAEQRADRHRLAAAPRSAQRIQIDRVRDGAPLAVRRLFGAVTLFGVPKLAFNRSPHSAHRLEKPGGGWERKMGASS